MKLSAGSIVNRVAPAIVLSLLCLQPLSASAQIYKCMGEYGRPQFSDKPCSKNAEIVEVKDHTSGISHGPKGDFAKIRSDIEQRELKRKIEKREGEILRLGRKRDAEIKELRRKQTYAGSH